MKQSESPFLKCMQVGAFGVVERCMIEMGVPRESALDLYKKIFDEKEIKVENRLELEQIIREKIRLEYKNIPYWIQVQLDFFDLILGMFYIRLKEMMQNDICYRIYHFYCNDIYI